MLSMPEDPYILYEILFTLLLLLIMTVVDNISNPPPPQARIGFTSRANPCHSPFDASSERDTTLLQWGINKKNMYRIVYENKEA